MTNPAIDKVSRFAIRGLLFCWIGLSFALAHSMIPELNVAHVMAKIINELPVFFNLNGGQPLQPTDFVMYLWE